jgi:ADP-L-glycero-D-manno-heptose 6-epimerase
MIIVTGGAGFIGSRLIKKLNTGTESGFRTKDIVIVDDLTNGDKIQNLKDLEFEDYIDKDNFIEILSVLAKNDMVESIYHLGAETSTSCNDGKYLMKNNYQFTCNIMNICAAEKVNLTYASSAAVYGNGKYDNSDQIANSFADKFDNYQPNNMYALSKLQADKYARGLMVASGKSKIMGVRYFNVHSDGEFEQHKEGMKSPTAWMKEQLETDGEITLFEGSENFKRDFIHIDEAVKQTINLMEICKSGVYNVGTGKARSFVDMAKEVGGEDVKIKYVPMPKELSKHYQKFTQANTWLYGSVN